MENNIYYDANKLQQRFSVQADPFNIQAHMSYFRLFNRSGWARVYEEKGTLFLERMKRPTLEAKTITEHINLYMDHKEKDSFFMRIDDQKGCWLLSVGTPKYLDGVLTNIGSEENKTEVTIVTISFDITKKQRIGELLKFS